MELTEEQKQTAILLWQAAREDKLELMPGRNIKTGEVEAILVIIEPSEDGNVNIYPVASLLDQSSDIFSIYDFEIDVIDDKQVGANFDEKQSFWAKLKFWQ